MAAKGQAAVTAAQYNAFSDRINKQIGEVQKGDRFAMERYDGMVNKPKLQRNIWSPEAYERIVKDGNQDRHLSELMKLYP